MTEINETIDLMMNHTSVRNFTEEAIEPKDLEKILKAAQMASTWKNFQSYSVIVVESQDQKDAIYEFQPQKSIKNCAAYLVFVGDLNRAQKAVELHQGNFQPQGIESLLITSVDAATAGQNALLAAESLGYNGVMVGLIRDQSSEISKVLGLPDYTYPIFGIALGKAARLNKVKPRLPLEATVFKEKYVEQTSETIEKYDQVQEDYAGNRRLNKWSERIVDQWGQPEISAST
ncbi:MAG: NADPH-dependent oxidoreductase [Lactococcus lactis]|nr:NADPH-dependent oxidoreductase [Lactococcus lactis]MDU1629599.1 NADPH-dependent oxidoreductase [Lactococcus lactis]MDU2184582.1 NADPH-dependent oxidoreductase [Lactococcus lactis]MDU3891588.1 NADPH-dependent oxidoreductase [Lactococcus lactis]MDU3960147.1 NADPH-dependent oxidoreductase [Lactococcus lactis]